jgi:hypothetical protein
MHGVGEKFIICLVENCEEKRYLGRIRRRWKDSTQGLFRVKVCGIDLTCLRQEHVREDCNTIMKFRVPKKSEYFFRQLMTHSIPKQTAQYFGRLVLIRGKNQALEL